LQEPEKNNIFTGEFWTGSSALKLGLIDGLGNADQILKEKFGEDVVVKNFEKPKSWIGKKLSASVEGQVTNVINSIEEKTFWQKFGL
jgi:ClpP class serine protease